MATTCPNITDLWPDPSTSSGIFFLAEATNSNTGERARLIGHGGRGEPPKSVELFSGGYEAGIRADMLDYPPEPIQKTLIAVQKLLRSRGLYSTEMGADMETQTLATLVEPYWDEWLNTPLSHYQVNRGDIQCSRHAVRSDAFRKSKDPRFQAALLDVMMESFDPYTSTLTMAATSAAHPGRVLVLTADRKSSSATYIDAGQGIEMGWKDVSRISFTSSRVADLREPLRKMLKNAPPNGCTQEEWTIYLDDDFPKFFEAAMESLGEINKYEMDLSSLGV